VLGRVTLVTKHPNNMITKTISSAFVNSYKGIGFWSGTRHRHLLIMGLAPAKQSRFTEFFFNLCVITNFLFSVILILLPVITIYFLAQPGPMRQNPQAAPFEAVILSLYVGFFAVVGFSFYRRVLVWPKLARDPREMAELFDDSSHGLLTLKGMARWKLFGISLGQISITGLALYYSGGLRNGALLIAIYLALWLPAILAIVMAAKVIKGVYAGNETFGDADKLLMSMRVTADLSAVTALIVGLVVAIAFQVIYLAYLAVLAIGAFILWRAFAAQTDPVNIAGLFDTPEKKTSRPWQDTSGSTHINGDGRITEAHTGAFKGTVDNAGRVTSGSGDHVGQVGGDGKLR
jgi:hypothetical protein